MCVRFGLRLWQFYPTADVPPNTYGFIGQIKKKATVRAADPAAFKVEFFDGVDDLYLTTPSWSKEEIKFLLNSDVKMLS